MSEPEELPLDGTWERPGRNPVRAAIAGLLVCGALYTTVGAVVLSVVALVVSSHDWSWIRAGSLVDFLLAYYRRFQVPILVVTAIMEFSVFLGLTLVLVRRWHSRQPLRYLRYRPPAAVDLLLAALGAVAVVPVAQVLDSWSYLLFPVLRELRGGEAALLAIHSPGQLALVVLGVSLTPAICEEVLFRGWLQGTVRRRAGAVTAIGVTGVLFALFHASPLSLAALAFVGFYLGYLFEQAGTLFASMTAHAVYNLTIIVLVNVDLKSSLIVADTGDITLPAAAVSAVVFALVVAAVGARGRTSRRSNAAGHAVTSR